MTNEQKIRFVYNAIVAYKIEHDGNSPLRDELAAIVRIDKSTLHRLVRVLEGRGLIRRESNRNQAGKIHVIGAVWLPPEGWQAPLDLEKRAAEHAQELLRAKEAGTLCECGEGVIQWQKQISFPANHVLLMCDECKRVESNQYGSVGISEWRKDNGGKT